MSLGVFMVTKNESMWIAPYLLRILPYIDEVSLFDNSTDGTQEIIRAIKSEDKNGHKINLHPGRDVKDLQDDYTLVFNDCLHSLSTDLAWFLHPDMYVQNPEQILKARESKALALSCRMRSFAGEPGGQLYEIKGRGERWKSIMRLRNPDLGLHYWGSYGHSDEDMYLRSITGNRHEHYGTSFRYYPYIVEDSGLEILHFSDVRPYARRLGRMVSCLLNNDHAPEHAEEKAKDHPRITLKDGQGFSFIPAEYPKEFLAARAKYQHLVRDPVNV